jgi:hypothetical protein
VSLAASNKLSKAVAGAATAFPKHDFSLGRPIRRRVCAQRKLDKAQATELLKWLDENSSSESPYPPLSAEIMSDLLQKTVSCVHCMRRTEPCFMCCEHPRVFSLQGATESLIRTYLSPENIDKLRRSMSEGTLGPKRSFRPGRRPLPHAPAAHPQTP